MRRRSHQPSTSTPASLSRRGLGGFAEQAFDDDRVAPLSIELAMSVIYAYLTEADFAAQPPACTIFGKNARDEFPEAARGACVNEPLQGGLRGTRATRGSVGIDREFAHARVTLTRAVGASSRPGQHLPILLGDDDRVAPFTLRQIADHVFGRTRVGIERRDALLNSLRINPGDRCSVGADGRAHDHQLGTEPSMM